MIKNNDNYMKSYHEKISKSVSFDRKNYTTVFIVVASILLLSGGAVAQVSSGYDVSIGQNGIEIGTGTLDVLGNDIESSGTTVFDGSAGQIATGVVDYTAATASDVGLGNVENIALSTVGGNDLTWNSGSSQLDVDSSSIQSGTTASDVGLGNVQNEAQVAESGDTMTGTLDLSYGGFEELALEIGNNRIQSGTADSELIWEDFPDSGIEIDESDDEKDMILSSEDTVILEADADADQGSGGTNNAPGYRCYINGDTGDFNCNGVKNWVHSMNESHNAFYTAQESSEVRAVYEGTVEKEELEDGYEKVELPEHFSMTVSDSKPMLRAQATPHELATVAVTERTDDYLVIESSKDVKVDYRITGIREGYEDKQVVRPKEE